MTVEPIFGLTSHQNNDNIMSCTSFIYDKNIVNKQKQDSDLPLISYTIILNATL